MAYRHALWSPLSLAACKWPLRQPLVPALHRSVRHQAFDASFDQEQLAEARKWHQSFQPNSLPEGNTSFSRSSGPGGQHVNKFVPWFSQPASLQLGLTVSGRKQKQQQHGRLPNCSTFCPSCCTRVCGSQSTTPNGMTASQYKHKPREAAAPIQTRTARNCLTSWTSSTARQCPANPGQKRPRNTRHCKLAPSLLCYCFSSGLTPKQQEKCQRGPCQSEETPGFQEVVSEGL